MNLETLRMNRYRAAASQQALRQRVEIFLEHGPAYHYTYGRWRLRRWLGRLAPAAGLGRRRFWQLFDLSQPELAAARSAAAAGDSAAANAHLAEYFRTRALPRWFFAPEELRATGTLVPGKLKTATINQANDICQNIFQFRRAEPVAFGAEIDWRYRPAGNKDWNWDLHRHLYWLTLGRAYAYTGDERYALKFQALLLDWQARNPPGVTQVAWSSVFEAAFRINTWLWAFYFFRQSSSFDERTCQALLRGLEQHGRFLDEYIELHAANNHLLLEAKALALLGLAMPELRQAGHWRQRGLALLEQEVSRQVCADGVHAERVSHYQQAIAGELLELLIWGENNQQALPEGLAPALGRMVEYQVWASKPNGEMPLLGDSGRADSHSQFSAAAAGPVWLARPGLKRREHPFTEMDYWLLGPARLERCHWWRPAEAVLTSRAFPEGGFVIMRHGDGPLSDYLIFDAAPFGYERVPGHGHADALSLELHALGQTWLVDPGVYATWAPAKWRNFFRSTRAHNTVVVDDQDQSMLVGTRLVYHAAHARLRQWLSDAQVDLADASHDGYERLAGSVTHRRQVLYVKPNYWVVFDQLTGTGEHQFDLLFHFMPKQTVRLDPATGRAQAGAPAGPALSLVRAQPASATAEVIEGATDPIQGWTALYSGEKQPAPVLRYRQAGAAPAEFCTVLYPSPTGAAVAAQPLEVWPEAGAAQWPAGQVSGLVVETAESRDLIVLDRGAPPAPKHFGGYSSHAQLTVIRQALDGELISRLQR
jgi:uncharacterized heparinase superfamily protein